jgi:hypothetical protein
MLVCLTAVVTAALGWPIAAWPAETSREQIAERARAITAQDIYQKSLVESPAPPSRSPAWRLKRSGGSRGPRDGIVTRIILYLVIGLAAGLVLVWLIGWLVQRRRKASLPGQAAGIPGKSPSGARISLQAIERMARSGDLGAAVRGLLHLAVSFLSSRRQLEVPESSTGRELERLLPRSDGEIAALALLVETVERSFFGGLPVDQQTYERCQKAFVRMTT